MIRLRIGVIPLVLGAGLFVSPAPTPAPTLPVATAPAAPDSLDDGPHVFWQNDTQPIVFYLCGGGMPSERLDVGGGLAFKGLCADSTTEYHLNPRPPEPARDVWEDVPRILAVSDIHGEYDALFTFLQRAGVVDTAGRWTWGNGHLVVVGDIVDRGNRVTECLWFLYRLEQEAARAGGHVHVVLGNHEMMVMRDDLRYVNQKYTGGIVRYSGIRYQDLFGPEMELGRWLRSKPFVLKLNDILFVHGGLATEFVARGLDIHQVNAIGRASLDLSSAAIAFSDVPNLLFGNKGPLWYRGYLAANDGRYPAATDAQVDSVLSFYDARAIVVGHTEIPQLMTLHAGRVFAIDVDLEALGAYQGLLWEHGVFSLVTGLGTVQPLN